MRTRHLLLALTLSLPFSPLASALSEFGIEGMGVVSTRADEIRATLSADGQRIIWASNREGGAGGWDLWQATLQDKRWMDPQPLALNSATDEIDPFLSADGRWLYFASNRKGGQGGFDLYRAPLATDGSLGQPQNLGPAVNGRQDERSPALADDAAPRLQAGQIRLDVELPEQAAVQGDAFLLRQALSNLLDNAIAFSAPGSRIVLSVQRQQQNWRIAVRDNGPGVPEYAQERVFERFYSLARPGTGQRSSGLGLPFVAEVARLHGGVAQLGNHPDGGAEARLLLPAG